jgi:Isopropylmalate/homocitrate/citramalate synthases
VGRRDPGAGSPVFGAGTQLEGCAAGAGRRLHGDRGRRVSASDAHNRRNLNRSTEESLDDITGLIQAGHDGGATVEVIIATSFGCPYQGDIDPRVGEIVDRVVATAPTGWRSATRPGMATPSRVISLLRAVDRKVPVLLHFHDTRGTGLANILTALELGVTEFDASIGGLGGCPYAPGPAATWPPRRSYTCCTTWAWTPASTWTS